MTTRNRCIKFKNDLNQIAEIGWEEKQTTKYIHQAALPLQPIIHGFGKNKTGLLYKIGRGENGILLRADIDGLQTGKGVKHICGHSSHTAGLIQALQERVGYEDQLTKQNKSIYFLFQPAEENYPSGAKAFITKAAHILPSIHAAFAAHVRPLMPVGTIGLKPSAIWARGDYMEITVIGKMVHVKDAPKGIDALAAAAEIILAVRAIQKKYKNTIRINIGTAQGGLQANTVADYAKLTGDIRLKNNKEQKIIKKKLLHLCKQIEKKTKTTININYYDGYPVMKNDALLTKKLVRVFTNTSQWNVTQHSSLFSFGCEDFCFISDKIPSVMALIGTGDPFDIHEANCTISDAGTEMIVKYFMSIVNWWLSYDTEK